MCELPTDKLGASKVLVTSEIVRPWIRPWYYLSPGDKLLDNNQAKASLAKFQQAIAPQRNYAGAWKSRAYSCVRKNITPNS